MPYENLLGKKFGRLLVVSQAESGSGGRRWNCRCDCNNTTVNATATLNSLHTQSCGCLRAEKSSEANGKDLTGRVFGGLTVLEQGGRDKNRRILWLCRCECEYERLVSSNHLLRKTDPVRYCGNCRLHQSGIRISQVQVNLHNMVGGSLNHKVAGYYADIALKKHKILIEYDGWYWHQHNQKRDKARLSRFLRAGWKVLAIKGNRSLPPKKEIVDSIDILKTTDQKQLTIVMDEWKGYNAN